MNKAESYNSPVIDEIIDGVDPAEASKIEKKMLLAARIDDALKAKGWKQKDLAAALKKLPSEISKWLSGTHNFTSDTLFDIDHILETDLMRLEDKPKEIVMIYPVISVSNKVAEPNPTYSSFITPGKGRKAQTSIKQQHKLENYNTVCQA